ncbi:MAG: bifunctional nicotinamidase/pyrazinamidase [Candidatus Helarchaeota archaeon]
MKISELELEKIVQISEHDAFIIIDVQNDFIPGGSLAVEKGDEIIDGINKVAKIFKEHNAKIILTQDWHPINHSSFASAHPDKNPFDEFNENGIGPVLWPDHCVQGTKGAEFHPTLNTNIANAIIRKGTNLKIDSYSGFIENDGKTLTGLSGYLKSLNINRIFLAGLALDFCVYYTAIDGKKLGFNVFFIIDLTRGIDSPKGSISNALDEMIKNNIKFIESKTILG